ncbi:MAG: hypothetical protein A3F13_00925 [Gammaproteobacteria bacterium RIFCSPHIGHO2_12_FULL_40_19]|nr:MAG: hypothetical protein A3F13_00925 [Gammaproteobacteria bacterium RIFCSPHIGHO2_12_FULL_40_19]
MKKIIMITGASQGIGAAIFKALSDVSDFALLVDKKDFKLNEIETKCSFKKFKVDLSDSLQVNQFIDELKNMGIEPNIIINNAGFGGDFLSIDRISEKEWDEIFGVNIKSQFLFSKAFLPKMKKNNYGKIISISSVQGFLGASFSSAYVASKHAVIGLIKTIASEWGSYGITANAISPGYVNTKMGVQDEKFFEQNKKIISLTPLKRIAEPNEIAALVKFLISDDANFINGENIVIDGGLTAHVGTQ